MGEVSGDCGGVRAHGTCGEGSIEEPERSAVVLVHGGNALGMPDDMDHS